MRFGTAWGHPVRAAVVLVVGASEGFAPRDAVTARANIY